MFTLFRRHTPRATINAQWKELPSSSPCCRLVFCLQPPSLPSCTTTATADHLLLTYVSFSLFSFSPSHPQFCQTHTEGCPGLCNGNGRCTLGNNGWYCVCQLGWRGTGCDTSMETACSDGKDNDGGKKKNKKMNKAMDSTHTHTLTQAKTSASGTLVMEHDMHVGS